MGMRQQTVRFFSMPSPDSLALVTEVEVTKIHHIAKSPYGTPYLVGLCNYPSTQTPGITERGTFLADGREHDLSALIHLVGWTVKVRPTPNGLRLSPPEEQSEELLEFLRLGVERPSQVELPLEGEDTEETISATFDQPDDVDDPEVEADECTPPVRKVESIDVERVNHLFSAAALNAEKRGVICACVVFMPRAA